MSEADALPNIRRRLGGRTPGGRGRARQSSGRVHSLRVKIRTLREVRLEEAVKIDDEERRGTIRLLACGEECKKKAWELHIIDRRWHHAVGVVCVCLECGKSGRNELRRSKLRTSLAFWVRKAGFGWDIPAGRM